MSGRGYRTLVDDTLEPTQCNETVCEPDTVVRIVNSAYVKDMFRWVYRLRLLLLVVLVEFNDR